MLGGVGASLCLQSASRVIAMFGMTGAQLMAIGALAYNILPMIILPLVGGEEKDSVEMDTNKYQFNNPYIP